MPQSADAVPLPSPKTVYCVRLAAKPKISSATPGEAGGNNPSKPEYKNNTLAATVAGRFYFGSVS